MRDLPDVRVFPSGLIDDMHRAFDAVSSTLRLWQSDKATALVVTKIVDLAKAGRRGDELIEQTLLAFTGGQAEERVLPVEAISRLATRTARRWSGPGKPIGDPSRSCARAVEAREGGVKRRPRRARVRNAFAQCGSLTFPSRIEKELCHGFILSFGGLASRHSRQANRLYASAEPVCPKIRLPGVALIIAALVDVAEWCPCVAARVGGVA
jgi:hypothetical protein